MNFETNKSIVNVVANNESMPQRFKILDISGEMAEIIGIGRLLLVRISDNRCTSSLLIAHPNASQPSFPSDLILEKMC